MSSSEFDVIKKYFTFDHNRDDVKLAGGDDCAIVIAPPGKQLLVTTDTLIEGVHFPPQTSAEDIAYKSIMVNLSDLAAMGATPAWLTLAITLPEINESWLQKFSSQFEALLTEFNLCLIGGDTTKGPLSITIQAMGLSEKDKIMRRDRAEVGDKIYVTGELGDAAIGLHTIQKDITDATLLPCKNRLNRPEARVKFGEDLNSFSNCAIDMSDGLVSDLGHIVNASHCGADIDLSAVPLSLCALGYFKRYSNNEIDWSMVLTQGDDYELCFTVNKHNQQAVESLANKHQLKVTCIGEITNSGVMSFYNNGQKVEFSRTGFKHF